MATPIGNSEHDRAAAIGQTDCISFARFTLDLPGRSLTRSDGADISLRRSEYDLLLAFLRAPGRVLSRDHLLDVVSGRQFAAFDRSIDVLVGRLRRKIEANPKSPNLVVTVPGIGYKFTARPAAHDNHPAAWSIPSRQAMDPSPAAPVENSPAQRAAERRQLTVMACGVDGVAELSNWLDLEELDEVVSAWHQCLDDIVGRYHGFIASCSVDSAVVFFGYPRADEHDGERAVEAALAMVQALPTLSPAAGQTLHGSVGIATGVVVAGDPARSAATRPSSASQQSAATRPFAAVGSTPSLAACLQSLAAVDQVVVAGSTRRLIGNAFALTDIGENDLPGLSEPLRAWRVEGPAVTASRFDAHRGEAVLTPLVGRDEELNLLLRRWSQAQDGEGQVVLLSGEPGIGKSRILSTLRERLDTQGAVALRLQCSPYHVNSAFWPIIDNLERTLKFSREEAADVKLDRLEALVTMQCGRPVDDVRFVASILSIPCEQRYGPRPMMTQKFKDETLRTLVDLTEAAARGQPSVMLFEDAHWADPTTLEVLDLLIDRVRNVPLLVVLTHRPEFHSRWPQHGHVGALNLSKLTRTHSAAMVSAIGGAKAIPATLLEQIVTRADGIPLFVEELTRSILEADELWETGAQCGHSRSARTVAIPATLRDSLMARLDRSMPVKAIAQIGAVIGREFSYEMIAAVAPMSPAQLDNSLVRLSGSGLVFCRGTPPDAIYTFKHALVQDVAYDSLLKNRRQQLHAKLAGVIEQRFPNIKITEPEVLAHHLTAAGLSEAAIPLWQSAGELALKRVALTEAVSHLNQGLELISVLAPSLERDASELELRTRLGTAWLGLKGWQTPEVWISLHPALALAKSLRRHDALLPILWGLALNVQNQGRIVESLRWVEEMLDIAEATGDADLLIVGHARACSCYRLAGELTRAREHLDKVLDLYDDEKHHHLAEILYHDPKTLAGVFGSINTWMLGYPDQASRLSNETDAHARRRGHPFDLGYALGFATHEFDRRRTPKDLHERAAECERLGRENSLPVLWAMCAPMEHGVALIREGKLAEGMALLKASIGLWEASGGKACLPTMNAFLAEAMALTNDLDNALRLIDEQIAQIERSGWGERHCYAEILRLKGWILSLKGDFEGAERNFLVSLGWARRQQAKSWELRTSTSLARLWQRQGKHHAARALLAPVYNWFTEGFDTKDLLDAKSLLAELEQYPSVAFGRIQKNLPGA